MHMTCLALGLAEKVNRIVATPPGYNNTKCLELPGIKVCGVRRQEDV